MLDTMQVMISVRHVRYLAGDDISEIFLDTLQVMLSVRHVKYLAGEYTSEAC